MSTEYETITLEFDNEESVECEIIGVFEVEGKDYMALAPVVVEENEEETEVFLYEYKEVGEEGFELADIESEELFDKVAAAFNELMEEE